MHWNIYLENNLEATKKRSFIHQLIIPKESLYSRAIEVPVVPILGFHVTSSFSKTKKYQSL